MCIFNLFSLYNLNNGKPGIRFAQGKEGIIKLFNETLKSKTEILAYADGEGWVKHFPKYLKWYEEERIKKEEFEKLKKMEDEKELNIQKNNKILKKYSK